MLRVALQKLHDGSSETLPRGVGGNVQRLEIGHSDGQQLLQTCRLPRAVPHIEIGDLDLECRRATMATCRPPTLRFRMRILASEN